MGWCKDGFRRFIIFFKFEITKKDCDALQKDDDALQFDHFPFDKVKSKLLSLGVKYDRQKMIKRKKGCFIGVQKIKDEND